MKFDINYHPSWNDFFTNKQFDALDELEKIENLIGEDYFPSPQNVLRFMKLDINNIKYVIVGMEPYPSSFEKNGIIYPEATGRSFEVASLEGKSWNDKFKQSSLRNIIKTIYYNETNEKIDLDTLRKKIEIGEFKISNPSIWFNKTEKQGVLWLNATLTVQSYKVDTHKKFWAKFMEEVIIYMKNENPYLKWVLWGQPAKERVLPLVGEQNCICTMHPRLVGFIDENCFSSMKDIVWKC